MGCVPITRRVGSSPLSRGILLEPVTLTVTSRIIPALAGNTSGSLSSRPRYADHPRSRGEYAVGCVPITRRVGSSPLSRGIPGLSEDAGWAEGIIPALAGNTGPTPVQGRARRDHPRSRGEYSRRMFFPNSTKDHPRSRGEYHRRCRRRRHRGGSSPLSRGILMCTGNR